MAYSDCTAKIEAVARLYDVIAANTSDAAQAEKLKATAVQRHEDAARFKEHARSLADGLGRSGEVDKLIADAAAVVDAGQEGKPFEEFAVGLGRQADQCAPLDPPRT